MRLRCVEPGGPGGSSGPPKTTPAIEATTAIASAPATTQPALLINRFIELPPVSSVCCLSRSFQPSRAVVEVLVHAVQDVIHPVLPVVRRVEIVGRVLRIAPSAAICCSCTALSHGSAPFSQLCGAHKPLAEGKPPGAHITATASTVLVPCPPPRLGHYFLLLEAQFH